jgi:hypothetical protein
VAYEKPEFGDTDTGKDVPTCSDSSSTAPGNSWWKLSVWTGDRVTVAETGETQGDGFFLGVYKPSVNDKNFVALHALASNYGKEADRSKVSFTAPSTGLMPLLISTCDSIGDYNFTASDEHRIIPDLRLTVRNRALHRTYFTMQVRNTIGGRVCCDLHANVYVRYHGKWIYRTTFAQPFKGYIPWAARRFRHRTWTVSVLVGGPGYQATTIKFRAPAV